MRWLLGAMSLVVAVWLLVASREEALMPDALDMAPELSINQTLHEMPKNSGLADERSKLDKSDLNAEILDEAARGRNGVGIISIGPAMDPDDPSSWRLIETVGVINIGKPMDPDAPYTWSASENTDVINIGEPMDPDDPVTWRINSDRELMYLGETKDPDDPATWPELQSSGTINIGEEMDPDDPSSWSN